MKALLLFIRMVKRHIAAVSLVGFLLFAGIGCGVPGVSVPEPIKKELRGKGDQNAAMSAADRDRSASDVKEIMNDVFGNGVKVTAQSVDDLVVKGGLYMAFSLPKEVDASQQGAIESAFKKAGYAIIDKQTPATTGEDQSGGVVAEKRNVVLYFIYANNEKQTNFIIMSSEQYAFVENSDTSEGDAKIK